MQHRTGAIAVIDDNRQAGPADCRGIHPAGQRVPIFRHRADRQCAHFPQPVPCRRPETIAVVNVQQFALPQSVEISAVASQRNHRIPAGGLMPAADQQAAFQLQSRNQVMNHSGRHNSGIDNFAPATAQRRDRRIFQHRTRHPAIGRHHHRFPGAERTESSGKIGHRFRRQATSDDSAHTGRPGFEGTHRQFHKNSTFSNYRQIHLLKYNRFSGTKQSVLR